MIERSFKWHVLFWVIFVIAGVASLSPYYQSLFKATMHRIVFLPVWLIVVYINLLILMPRFWDSRKWFKYSASIILLIFALTIIQRFICINYIYPKYFWMRAPNSNEINIFWSGPFVQFMFYIAFPVVLTGVIREGFKWYRESVLSRQLVAQQQAAELEYLKAQINPHFLFNTLNNLYGLSLESSKKVPEMILKLSDILSYSLYEFGANRITIGKELKLINDFIQLEKERFEDRVKLLIKIDSSIDQNEGIAPLLLMPLVENAFKHGVKESIERVTIKIHMIKVGDEIQFSVVNEIASDALQDSSKSGIGLKNLRRRLKLQYPGNFSLNTDVKAGHYHAVLKIRNEK